MSRILIYAELSRNNKIKNVVFELAEKACELSKKLDNCEVNAYIICDEFTDIDVLKNSLFNKIYIIRNEVLKDYNTDYYTKISLDIIAEQKPEIVLIGATSQGRDLAPRIAASLNTGLTADCTGLDITEEKKLAATRPTFGGKLMATILNKNFPQMATVRSGVFKDSESQNLKNTEIIYVEPKINGVEKKVQLIKFIEKVKSENDLESADIIIAAGRGIKTKENFEKIKLLAKKLNASVAATRCLVDMGWVPNDMQIGQTGKTVAPKIYVAFGISGAIQHVVGMENSGYIIAINNDKNADIFNIADFGIVADTQDVLDELLKE